MNQSQNGNEQISIVERPYKVDKPVFIPYEVKQPVFVDKQVDVPVGFDKVISDMADKLFIQLKTKLAEYVDGELSRAITTRIKEIEVPHIIEKHEIQIVYKDVHIDRPIIKDMPMVNAIITDKQVINAIVTDVPVANAVVYDINVTNAVIKNVPVKNFVLTRRPE